MFFEKVRKEAGFFLKPVEEETRLMTPQYLLTHPHPFADWNQCFEFPNCIHTRQKTVEIQQEIVRNISRGITEKLRRRQKLPNFLGQIQANSPDPGRFCLSVLIPLIIYRFIQGNGKEAVDHSETLFRV